MMQFKTGTEAQLLGNHVLAGETVLLIEDSVLFSSPSPHPNIYFAARKNSLVNRPFEKLLQEEWVKNYFFWKKVVEYTRTNARSSIILALYRSEFRVKGSRARRRGKRHRMRRPPASLGDL